MLRRSAWGAAISACVLIACASSVHAEIHDVDVGPGFGFSPADLTIEVGDTVRWTWIGGTHNVESGTSGSHDGNFRSGDPTSVAGTVFEVTFDQTFVDDHPMPNDEYPYYCVLHQLSGMTGTVTVKGPVTCLGDIDESGAVNVFDLLDLLANWGTDGAGADLAEPNDVVNVFDLLELLSAWGPCE